jgi:hypothetical protein
MPSFSVVQRAQYIFAKKQGIELMWKTIGVLIAALTSVTLQAQEITTCRSPSGKSFYHFSGMTDKSDAGWTDDKISKGFFTLRKIAENKFDILYIDGNNKPTSSTQDGAMVQVLRLGKTNITLLVYYPSSTTEIYSFFKETDGKFRFTFAQNKTGDEALVSKSTLLVGVCDPIRFDVLR